MKPVALFIVIKLTKLLILSFKIDQFAKQFVNSGNDF